jgi:putative colanic acid biosynthesis acetyltransferase WcaF
MNVDLSSYQNKEYRPGGSSLKRIFWYLTNILWFKSSWIHSSPWKRFLLRLYGARIGKGVVIKPNVNIKYPWRLSIGDYAWIGEGAWIDNLGDVSIGANVCVSQGAMLLCGNHDYKKTTFDLIVGDIILEEGSWIGAKSLVGPGVTVRSHAVLAAGSVTSKDLEAFTIYQGNPAKAVRDREIS